MPAPPARTVTFDQYPYPAASTVLHSLLPYWVHAGGPAALLTRLADPAIRDLMVRAVEPQWGGQTLDNYIFAHIASDRNKEWEGPVAGRTGSAPWRAHGRRRLRPVAGRAAAGGIRSPHRQPGKHPGNSLTPGADDRHRRHTHRWQTQSSHLWHLSLRIGSIRPR